MHNSYFASFVVTGVVGEGAIIVVLLTDHQVTLLAPICSCPALLSKQRIACFTMQITFVVAVSFLVANTAVLTGSSNITVTHNAAAGRWLVAPGTGTPGLVSHSSGADQWLHRAPEWDGTLDSHQHPWPAQAGPNPSLHACWTARPLP